MRLKNIFFLALIIFTFEATAQQCDCNKEFVYIRDFIEKNYVGFSDKVKTMTKPVYTKMMNSILASTKDKYASQKCLLLIAEYLRSFKDDHIQIGSNFDGAKLDSLWINQGENISIPEEKINTLKTSKGIEGIYYFNSDSTYKIAVIKNKNNFRDYTGVLLDSKLPHWKRGQIKFEARQLNDSMLKGVLYMRNHMPKVEWFFIGKNTIGGDWLRQDAPKNNNGNNKYQPVASKKLSEKTLYIKVSSFSPSNANNIDSVFKANKEILATIPNLILDLRNNGGGSDFAFQPIVPYVVTGPVKNIGVDVLSTDANIVGWKRLMDDKEIPEATKAEITVMLKKMEDRKGKLVNIVPDETDTTVKPLPFPKKVIILINEGCASTTEQFLLLARQSSKVILVGQPTQGTLDYSNMRETSFSCMPYTLYYATTRSRRLDVNQGIDNVGIKPKIVLNGATDWVEEALKIAEK